VLLAVLRPVALPMDAVRLIPVFEPRRWPMPSDSVFLPLAVNTAVTSQQGVRENA
jgi:hypothetical protein